LNFDVSFYFYLLSFWKHPFVVGNNSVLQCYLRTNADPSL
jgi:hypothetical protein